MTDTPPDNEERPPAVGPEGARNTIAGRRIVDTDSTPLGVTVPLASVPCPYACSPGCTIRCPLNLRLEVLAAVEYVAGVEVLS